MTREDWVDRLAWAIVTNQPTSITEEAVWNHVPGFAEDVAKRVAELGKPELAEALLQPRTVLYRAPAFEHQCQILVPDFSAVTEELMAYLALHPEDVHKLNWRQFEEVLGSIFRNHGFGVELGPGRRDGGVDLRLIRKDPVGQIITLVQAKKYRRDRKVGLEAVAALEGLLDANRAHRGLFVTTSEFLPGARRFAAINSFRLQLADEQKVIEWLRNIRAPNA